MERRHGSFYPFDLYELLLRWVELLPPQLPYSFTICPLRGLPRWLASAADKFCIGVVKPGIGS
jgi:hypothetical protein